MTSIFRGKPYRYDELCGRLDIAELYEPVFRYRSRRSNTGICLRPVCLPADEDLVMECTLLEWTKKGSDQDEDRIDAEKKVLKAIADSDSGQTFLGTIDDRPAFLAGVHKALQYPVSGSGFFKAREADYFLTLLMPPFPGEEPMDDLSLSVLQACLTHYFSYPAVENVMARVDKNNLQETGLYESAGFRFLRDVEQPFRLYYHTGAGYLDR